MGRRQLAAVATLVGVVAAGCTGDTGPVPIPTLTATPVPTANPVGGSVVFGAEQWPECLNPITVCATDWAFYTVLEHVLPRAMEVSADGRFVASPLLREAPTLLNGDISQTPFSVTFHIRDDAVWDDGSAITSADIAFTWRAILHTSGSTHTSGYDRIVAVDTPDSRTAVLRFDDVYAPWPELFGGSRGFVLKAAAFPDADPDRPDLASSMHDSLPFSGGPWVLTTWGADRAVLVRNGRYWGGQTLLDQVTFVPASGSSPEALQRFLSGELDAMSPSFEVGNMLDHVTGLTGVDGKGGPGMAAEIVWFDLRSPPLNDPGVRFALAHAIDRQAIVDKLVYPADPDAAVLNCGLVALPGAGPWCATQPFARFNYDPEQARRDLHASGYDCSNRICTKDGRELRIDYGLDVTSELQNAVEALIGKQARTAGIDLRPQSAGDAVPGTLLCPPLHFATMGCARAASVDPSITDLISCSGITTEANGFYGQNSLGWCNDVADQLARQADRELDPDRRRELMAQLYDLEANDVVGLPLFVVPTLSLWRDKLDGPIGDYGPTVYGMFFNMDQWYLVSQ